MMRMQKIIVTGFGVGYSPFAPGTMGALLATLIWVCLSFLLTYQWVVLATIGLILLCTVLGVWATNAVEPVWGEDPSRVVIDEMVGVWIALLAVAEGNLYHVFIAFVLFRLFDIFKPLGIRWMEKIRGGWGVMMDDVLAGIYSFVVLGGIRWIMSY